MQHETATARYRQFYLYLLRFYPKPYRERFGEGMGQVFTDLCRERTEDGRGLFTFVLWMFGDTCMGIVSLRISFFFSFLIMNSKHILRPAIITMSVLLIPAVAMLITDEMNWDETDFIVIGILVFGLSFLYEMLSLLVKNPKHRIMLGLGLFGLCLLIWADLAVGIFNIPGFSGS